MIASTPWSSDERLAPVARSPEIHVVAGSTKHDVAVRGAAWCCSTVRPAEDDVVAGTAIHHIVAVQAEHDVIATAAVEDVSAVERLIRDRARLDHGVRLIVVIDSDEELGTVTAFDKRCLRRLRRTKDEAEQRDEHAGGQCGQTETRPEFQLTHCCCSPAMKHWCVPGL